jgi:OOP family OmpA-OmpF porin
MPSSRSWGACVVTVVALACGARHAAADPYQLGGFFGPRFFSKEADLGTTKNDHTYLDTTVALGARFGRPLFAWFVPELELGFASAQTHEFDTHVYWFEPRAQGRFVWPRGKVRPFATLGFGVPMTASQHRGIYAADATWDPYGGIGVQFAPGRAINFRLDVRVAVTAGYAPDTPVTAELEATAGIYIELGDRRHRATATGGHGEHVAEETDGDGDGILDAADQCPERAEDVDQFQDDDGCPDIDNDLDQVLDIADSCPSIPETYNGFEDDDGCVDSVPGDVDAVLGTIEGLLYNAGSTEVPDTAKEALDKIADVLKKYPSITLLVIGHTDDREAEIEDIDGEAPEDRQAREDAALEALAEQRATSVADAFGERGIPRPKIHVLGKGHQDPVSDDDTPRHRLRNRRVEVQLFVPNPKGDQ